MYASTFHHYSAMFCAWSWLAVGDAKVAIGNIDRLSL
jgi:hypothetical protein